MIEINTISVTEIVKILHPIGIGRGTNWDNGGKGIATHELIFRLNGESRASFDNRELYTIKGDIKYLPKGQGRLSHTSLESSGECINVFFNSDIPLSDKPFVISCDDYDEYRKLFERIESIWLKKDTGYRYGAMSALYKILQLIQKSQDALLTSNPGYLKIKPAIDHICLNFKSSDLDLRLAAELCRISYSYFRVLFTECMGISPSRYVVERRIDYAKDLLSTRQYTVDEISRMVGFKDVYYFSHVFKKLEGCAPSKYIQKAGI